VPPVLNMRVATICVVFSSVQNNVTRSLVSEGELGVTAVVHYCPRTESSKFPLEYPRILILVLLLKLIKLHLQNFIVILNDWPIIS
jgi:hypothetical protein